MAEMTTAFGEKLWIFDRNGDAAAQAGAGHAILEIGSVVRFGIACWFLWHTERSGALLSHWDKQSERVQEQDNLGAHPQSRKCIS